MPTQQQVAKFAAIVAANENNKTQRATLTATTLTATVEFDALKAGTTSTGADFYTLPSARVIASDGSETVRTVMAFRSACALIRQAVYGGNELVAELKPSGGTLKVVAVLVDGAMAAVEDDRIQQTG